MKKASKVWAILVLIVVTISLCTTNLKMVHAGGIADVAEACKLGKAYKGYVDHSNRAYYRINLKKKSNIEIKISCSGEMAKDNTLIFVNVYDNIGEKAVNDSSFEDKYNSINGIRTTKARTTLKKGVYYIEIFSPGQNQKYKLIVNKI